MGSTNELSTRLNIDGGILTVLKLVVPDLTIFESIYNIQIIQGITLEHFMGVGVWGLGFGVWGKGHVVKFADGPFGGYQAIARDPVTGVYAGASESRKDGQAAGY
jgi:hypothetical protein